MTKSDIILAIISSSVLSSILTAIVNWRMHNSVYKKDYHKKILDKRIHSIEIAQAVSSKLSFRVQLDNYLTPGICYDEKTYQNFIYNLATAIDNSFWIGNEIGSKLTELNVFLLNEINNNINENWEEDLITEKYRELGSNKWEQIKNLRKQLEILIAEELQDLYKIDTFLKNKKKVSPKKFEVFKSKAVE